MKKYKIVATLTYGKKLSVEFMTFMTIIMLLCVAMIPLIIFCAIDSGEYGLFTCFIFPFLVLPTWVYIQFLYWKENRDIEKWQKDAVPLTAWATEIGRIKNGATHVTRIKIALTFTFDGKEITLRSGEKNKIKENIFYMNIGYDAIFCKYVGRPIQILYSPQYDEVMILKRKN